LTGGELGGALDAGARLINNTRRDVGLLAAGIVGTFNAQHASGDDLSGQPGEAFFEPLDVAVTGTRTNSGQSTITATILDVGELTGDGFSVAYEEAGIRLTNLRTGNSELVADGVLDFDGLRLEIQAATPAMTGDVFFIEPSLGAAARMEVAITDGASIAAANRDGAVGDNRNMLSLIALRDSSSLKSGTQSYTSFYGATLSGMAVETRSAISNAETEQSLLRSAEDRLEGLIGVNLDEEATNLIRYQQAYQAAAQVITVANEMFDTLLMASRR
jgi:flagellar hook-associated protein 1 FlgK